MSKNKGIRVWKRLEVGALYQYVNCLSAQRDGETVYYGFVGVSMPPSSSLCEVVMKADSQDYDCEYVYPGDNLVFLGQRSILPGKALTLLGAGWDDLLCFLHPTTGKILACDIGECFFRKITAGETESNT